MNKWFRRTNLPDGEGAVGLLEVSHVPDEGPSPRSVRFGPMVGRSGPTAPHDTLDLQRCLQLSAADTVVLVPVRREPTAEPREPSVPRGGDGGQYDPRLDAWLPKLDRWPRLNGRGPDQGRGNGAGGPGEGRRDAVPGPADQRLSPPSWPASGLPAIPAQTALDRRPTLGGDASLPGGAIGGLSFGGGVPCDGPLFGPNTTLAEMPWRAAAGEAHSMTGISAVRPGRLRRPAPPARVTPAPPNQASQRRTTPAPAPRADTAQPDTAPCAETTQPGTAPRAETTQPGTAPRAETAQLGRVAASGGTTGVQTMSDGSDAGAPDVVDDGAGQLLIFEQLRRDAAAAGTPAPTDVDWSALLVVPELESPWFPAEHDGEPATTGNDHTVATNDHAVATSCDVSTAAPRPARGVSAGAGVGLGEAPTLPLPVVGQSRRGRSARPAGAPPVDA